MRFPSMSRSMLPAEVEKPDDDKYEKRLRQQKSQQWMNILLILACFLLVQMLVLLLLTTSGFMTNKKQEPDTTTHHHHSSSTHPKYADKYVENFLRIARDPDCLTRTFDASSDPFDAHKARAVFQKCKILVLRNVFSAQDIRSYQQQKLNSFILGLQSGNVSQAGGTTNGEAFFMPERGPGRHEVIIPRNLVDPSMLNNEHLLRILKHDKILGPEMVLHSAGVNLAEARSSGQMWHTDEKYPFGPYDSFSTFGVAGHDLGAYAVTALFPLLEMHRRHGPTEFCVGSSALQGLPLFDAARMSRLVQNTTLLDDPLYRKLVRFGGPVCPPELIRAPLLHPGDVLLFDYQLTHRGGWNQSPDTRAVLFLTYARAWFKDTNFRTHSFREGSSSSSSSLYMLDRARLAQPTYSRTCSDCSPDESLEACSQRIGSEECAAVKSFDLREFTTLTSRENRKAEGSLEKLFVSNKDVTGGVLYLNGKRVMEVPVGESHLLEAKVGDRLELESPGTGQRLEWPVRFSGHLVFSADMQE